MFQSYFLFLPPTVSPKFTRVINKLMCLYLTEKKHTLSLIKERYELSRGALRSDLYDKLALINDIRNGDLDSPSRSSLILHLSLDIIGA